MPRLRVCTVYCDADAPHTPQIVWNDQTAADTLTKVAMIGAVCAAFEQICAAMGPVLARLDQDDFWMSEDAWPATETRH